MFSANMCSKQRISSNIPTGGCIIIQYTYGAAYTHRCREKYEQINGRKRQQARYSKCVFCAYVLYCMHMYFVYELQCAQCLLPGTSSPRRLHKIMPNCSWTSSLTNKGHPMTIQLFCIVLQVKLNDAAKMLISYGKWYAMSFVMIYTRPLLFLH